MLGFHKRKSMEGNVTWLVAEDDGDIRMVVTMMMTVWGEKPMPFPDGKSAWAWLDSVENGTFQGELPELALMDIRMPGYTGDQIAERIRRTDKLKHIPIILMTAFSLTDAEVAVMRARAGIDHLINKPLPEIDTFRTLLYRIRDERKLKAAAEAARKSQSANVVTALATNTQIIAPPAVPPPPPDNVAIVPPPAPVPAAPAAPPAPTGELSKVAPSEAPAAPPAPVVPAATPVPTAEAPKAVQNEASTAAPVVAPAPVTPAAVTPPPVPVADPAPAASTSTPEVKPPDAPKAPEANTPPKPSN